jgi:hypothetical protein
MHKAECDPPRGLLDVFIATFDDRKDSIIRNPWIAARVIRAKRERVLSGF